MPAQTQNTRKRVLYIDDDYTDQKLVEIILSHRAGISVDGCFSATAAMPMISRNGYDAILVDYHMPIINGAELIKKIESIIHCPVYIVSGHDREFIEDKVKQIGIKIKGFIPKMDLRKNLEAMLKELYGPSRS